MKEVHILNGDSLREQFPPSLPGEVFVARECLIDGNVQGDSLEDFFENRAHWLSQNYGGPLEEYQEKTKAQFEAILALPEETLVNLWFEEDLFCQVNLWFVSHLIQSGYANTKKIYLVLPKSDLLYGFAALNQNELCKVYEERQALTELEINALASMWQYYRNKDIKSMFDLVDAYRSSLPFLEAAVKAYQESLPDGSGLNTPQKVLQEIIKEQEAPNFGAAFRAFAKRLPIYGYGDLQVKRMWDELVSP